MEDDGLTIDDLLRVLEWRHDGHVPIRLYRRYVLTLSTLLGQAIGRAEEPAPALGAEAIAGLRRLPDRAFVRFLTAPRSYHHLRWPATPSALPFLADAITAELHRAGRPAPRRAGWTALGDWWSDGSGAGRPRHSPPRSPANSGVYEAPRLANGIPLDVASPQATDRLEGITEAGVEFDPDELDRVRRRLDDAVAGIGAIAAPAATFLVLFTKVVVARKTGAPMAYASSSTNAQIGRTVVVNPQLPGIEASVLADTLVHEAIHALLYVWELRRPFVLDPTVNARTVRSPWTGATLPLHSYLHACWVWFGLWRFWERARVAGVFREASDDLRTRAERGFVRGSLLEPLRDCTAAIAPEVREAITRMEDAVRRAVSRPAAPSFGHRAPE